MIADARLRAQVDPATTVLLTVECQQGVVGADSALPELAEAARESGALDNVARLVAAAHAAGVQVMHALAVRRPDGRGASRNARLFRAAERLPVQQIVGTPAAQVAAPIAVSEDDLVIRRLHGLSPLAGTDADALLRNLGCRTVVITGVSANVAIPNAVFDAVNAGYVAVVPEDAITGVPAAYVPALVRHSLALVATVTRTDDVVACWEDRQGPTESSGVSPAQG
jgi:nicotinamidase-related amidase